MEDLEKKYSNYVVPSNENKEENKLDEKYSKYVVKSSDVEKQIRSEKISNIKNAFTLENIKKATIESLPEITGMIPMAGGVGVIAKRAIQGQPVKEILNDPQAVKEIAQETALSSLGLVGTLAKPIGRISGATLKSGAEDVIQASKVLGVKPTTGQLVEGKVVGNVESNLYKTPYIGGRGLQKQIQTNIEQIQKVSKEVLQDAGIATDLQTGYVVRKGFQKELENKIKPAVEIYNNLETTFKNSQAIKTPIIDKINELKNYYKADEDTLAFIEKQERNLNNVNTIDELKRYRTNLGKSLEQTASQNKKDVLSELYGPITESRNMSIALSAESSLDAPRVAQIKNDIEKADKIYKSAIKDAREAFGIDKLKGDISTTVEAKLNKMNDTEIASKLFNTRDINTLSTLKEKFPEQYELLRKNYLRQTLDAVSENNMVNPRKLVNIIDKLQPEARELVFGSNNKEIIDALNTYMKSIPKDMHPSGTPRGIETNKMFNIFDAMIGSAIGSVVGNVPGAIVGAGIGLGGRSASSVLKKEYLNMIREGIAGKLTGEARIINPKVQAGVGLVQSTRIGKNFYDEYKKNQKENK